MPCRCQGAFVNSGLHALPADRAAPWARAAASFAAGGEARPGYWKKQSEAGILPASGRDARSTEDVSLRAGRRQPVRN